MKRNVLIPNDQELAARLVELAGSQAAAGELVGLSQRAISYYMHGRPIKVRAVRQALEHAVDRLEHGVCPCCGGSGARGDAVPHTAR